MTSQIPDQPEAIAEFGNGATVDRASCARIQDINRLFPTAVFPIKTVDGHLVPVSVFEIDVNSKAV